MTKRLRIPDEPHLVQTLVLAVDPGDTLGLLMDIGALGSPDLAIVRNAREALAHAYNLASDQQDWEQVHTISVVREALALPDSAVRPIPWAGGADPGRSRATTSPCPSGKNASGS